MKTTHIKALPDFTGRIVNFIKASARHMCIQMASMFLFSILLRRFLSRALDNFVLFSGPNSVGYFVEPKNVAFISLGPIISQ
jgi:hypothetical protein